MFLKSYISYFNEGVDIDQIWNEHCEEGKSELEKTEAKKFIVKVSTLIDPSRAQFYDKDQFDSLY